MVLTSILALTDFSLDGDRALARAGEIALEHHAVLRIMYLPSGTHPECLDPDTRLVQTASAMARGLGLTVRAVGAGDYSRSNILLQAEKAKLLVLPLRSEQGMLGPWLAGPDAIRFARDSRCPVLLARGAIQRRLRQIVVGVDLTPASHHRAQFACLLGGDAQVELFHAVSTFDNSPLRAGGIDHHSSTRYRHNCIEQEARLQMARMTQSLPAQTVPVVTLARVGEQAEHLMARLALTDADLVVVGKSRRHAATDWLLGSTAHDLLAQSPCDVMVVPEDFTFSTLAQQPAPSPRNRTGQRPPAWFGNWTR